MALILAELRTKVVPGVTTAAIDQECAALLARYGARSEPQRAYGFPGSLCVSVNDDGMARRRAPSRACSAAIRGRSGIDCTSLSCGKVGVIGCWSFSLLPLGAGLGMQVYLRSWFGFHSGRMAFNVGRYPG